MSMLLGTGALGAAGLDDVISSSFHFGPEECCEVYMMSSPDRANSPRYGQRAGCPYNAAACHAIRTTSGRIGRALFGQIAWPDRGDVELTAASSRDEADRRHCAVSATCYQAPTPTTSSSPTSQSSGS